MNINDLRAKYKGYSDDEILQGLRASKYPDYSLDEIKSAIGYKPPSRGMLAFANDTVIEAANAAAGAVGSAADFVSPGNAVSRFIDEKIIRPGEASQSDAVKAEKARYRTEMEGAEGIGDEIGSTLGYVARNPVLSLAQAAGSFVAPGLAVKGGGMLASIGRTGAVAERAAVRGGLAGGAVAGAALSGGDAAGTAYELVKNAGGTDDEATEAARKASVLPAAIGAAGGVIGAERLLAGAGGFKGGMLSRALKTAGVEGVQEGIEEGVTQYEGQRAAVPFDPSIDPMKGVAGAATMGAVLGAATGGGVSLLTGERQQPKRTVADVLAAPTIDDAIAAATAATSAGITADGEILSPDAKPRQVNELAIAEIRALDSEQQTEALGLLATAQSANASPAVRRFAQNRLDELLLPVRQIPVGEVIEEEAIPTGETQELSFNEATSQILEPPTFDQRRTMGKRVPTGEATELTVEDVEPVGNIPVGEVIEGDLQTSDGMPYGSKVAANVRAKREGLGPDNVVEIPGAGWVVRPILEVRPTGTRGTSAADVLKAPNVPVADLARTPPGSAGSGDGASPVAGGSGGTVRPDTDVGRVRGAATPEQRSGTADAVGAGGAGNTALKAGNVAGLATPVVPDGNRGEVVSTQNPEQRTAPPVAESPSPRDRDSGDGGVAPTRAGGVPDIAAAPRATTAKVEPDDVVEPVGFEPVHPPRDRAKLQRLTDDMKARGWVGRPLLAWEDDSGGKWLLTGSHRYAAAKAAGIEMPVVYLADGSMDAIAEATDQSSSQIIGAGDDRVEQWLRDAGDERAADLMQAEMSESSAAPTQAAPNAAAPEVQPPAQAAGDRVAAAPAVPTVGMEFTHRRVLDANNKPMRYRVTRIAQGVVYYAPTEGGKSEKTGVDEFDRVVKPDEATGKRADGRTTPSVGAEVFTYGAGMGGSRSVVSGTVAQGKNGLNVRIKAGAGVLGERVAERTIPLSGDWTVAGEEHPDDRQRRESSARLEADSTQRKDARERMLTEAAQRNGTLDPASVKEGDVLAMPDGSEQTVESIGDKGEIYASADGSGGRYIGKDMRGIKVLRAAPPPQAQPGTPAPVQPPQAQAGSPAEGAGASRPTPAVAPAAEPSPAKVPPSFAAKHKVTTMAYIEAEGKLAPTEMDAKSALAALDEDITEMRAFIACLKG
jgi:hypothetical protein